MGKYLNFDYFYSENFRTTLSKFKLKEAAKEKAELACQSDQGKSVCQNLPRVSHIKNTMYLQKVEIYILKFIL